MAKTGQEAKTAHGAKTQKHFCECGGLISVSMKFKNNRLKPEAECGTCHKTARQVRSLCKIKW
jgi:hypothetical protein